VDLKSLPHRVLSVEKIPQICVASEVPPNSDSASAETSKLPARLPTGTQLVEDYITALGGAAVIERITTRVEEGVVTYDEKSSPVEIFSSDPDKQSVIRHLAEGDSTTTFDGRNGSFAMPGHPRRPLQGEDLDAARLDADLHFPLHIRQIFPELRVEYPEKVGDLQAYVLVGVREGQPLVKFYFDERSSLLVRLVRYTDSVLGLEPTQVDYSDYRNVDGVQIPFRWTLADPHHISAIQLKRVQQNVPIDASRFANPPSGAPSRRAP
jgi:hypothetical protein